MAKKPVGISAQPVNVSNKSVESTVISVIQASKVTVVEPANRQKGHNESSNSGGSIFHGLRLLKFGEYSGKRTWKAVIESGHQALIGTTERNGNKWIGMSFSGRSYTGKTRDEICKLMTLEFLSVVGLAP